MTISLLEIVGLIYLIRESLNLNLLNQILDNNTYNYNSYKTKYSKPKRKLPDWVSKNNNLIST